MFNWLHLGVVVVEGVEALHVERISKSLYRLDQCYYMKRPNFILGNTHELVVTVTTPLNGVITC